MASWEFATAEPITATISIPSGTITISAMATETTSVTVTPARQHRDEHRVLSDLTVGCEAGHLVVGMPRRLMAGLGAGVDVTIELPERSSCEVSTASADVRCTGDLAALTADTASGDLAAELVTGLAELRTSSGDVHLSDVGTASVITASGDVRLSRTGDARVKTASGDVEVACARGGLAEVRTASGDVRLAVARGRDVYLDISTNSGDVRNYLEPSDQAPTGAMTVRCHTASGDITIDRAAE